MAENVFAVTQTSLDRPVRTSSDPAQNALLSSGRPIRDVEVQIRDADGSMLQEPAIGEVWIKSPFLLREYYKLPELSGERLQGNWFRTGDIGFFEAGELFVIGRIDDIVNINGKKIAAHEIEDELSRIPKVIPGRVLVYGEEDRQFGANQLSVAAETDEADAEARALSTEISRRVFASCGTRPTKVRLLPRGFLIKSTSGKISRSASVTKIDAAFREDS